MVKSIIYRPETLLVLTFGTLILIGTALLQLPIAAAQPDEPLSLVDAGFTATSAACVTGLITRDTATAFSRFGQIVILILIQLGGLGIMSFGALAAQVFRLRISFTSQAAWQSVFFEGQKRGNLRRALRRILLMTIVIEAFGALSLYAGLRNTDAPSGDGFEAVFLAISAFCNAGFSVYSDSAVGLRDSNLIIWTLMILIVAGGLGYTVLLETGDRTWRRIRRRDQKAAVWSLQSKLVLKTSAALILVGALILLLTGLTAGEGPFTTRAIHALFQSVTARTAGFNTINIGALPVASLLILMGLMFIGGSPGSCAGGIKTTTAGVWLARVRARLRGREDVTLENRCLPHDVVRRAALVLAIAALWNALGIIILAITEGGRPNMPFEHLVFEQVSAFGTVGLSAGLTPSLSLAGKLWIMATMFVGRLGPLTIALAVLSPPRALYKYPTERVMIG